MIRKLFLVLPLASSLLLGILYIRQAKLTSAHADANSVIPQSFGSCRGAMGDNLLIFEDSYGTVRLVHPASGTVFGTVTRK